MAKEKDECNHLSCGCGHCHDQEVSKNKSSKNVGLLNVFGIDLIKILVAAILFVFGEIIEDSVIKITLFSCSALAVGYELVFGFVKNIIKGRIFDENTLMIIASAVSFVIGFYSEGALIVLLFTIGETLERVATYNSKRKIAGLSEIKSTIVHLVGKDGVKEVAPELVGIGSLIQIKKGERVPIDGTLFIGSAEFDAKAITGESKPYVVSTGENVYSGSVNTGETVIIKTTKLYKDSTVEQIISMVEGALSKKSKAQKFIVQFAKIYTPIIAIISLLVAVIPPLFDQMNFYKWIYKALSFLVISCPCALVISVPLAYFVGIGALAKLGVLVKGSSYVDVLSRVDTIVLDKTGTITQGEMLVKDFKNYGEFDDDYLKSLLYAVESNSTHPISRAVANAFDGYSYRSSEFKFSSVKEISGRGISAILLNNDVVLVGNEKMMLENGVMFNSVRYDQTVVYLAINNNLCAVILLGDKVKEESRRSLIELRKLGVNNQIILSGDSRVAAEKVGEEVGIDSVYYELLPNEKLEKFNEIKNSSDKKVCYVGDGINDSPTLAAADVGVSMGGLGSEIAIESSDVVIMDDNLSKLPVSVRHSRKIRFAVIQNVIGSLVVKFAVMILSLAITLPVYVAMFADVGVMMLAVLNSLRLCRIKSK